MAEADPGHAPILNLDLGSLGVIDLDQDHLEAHRIVAANSGDSRSRAFNLLRTSLTSLFGERNAPRLVGITSATPAAGKSFISINAALSLAKVSEGDVVLVDLDLRRGSIAVELGLEPSRGIGDVLLGKAGLQQVGVRVNETRLSIFPTNAAANDSAELLAGPLFTQIVSTFRSLPANAVVLFDLPPVFANDDAMLTIKHLDGYILVVDGSTTSKSHVQDALSILSPASCVGTILNRYTGRVFDKYGYGYGSGAYGKYYEG